MKTLKNLSWVWALAALAACNPYSNENTGAPNITQVFAAGGNAGAATDTTVADGTLDTTSGQWTIESTSTCVMNPAGDPPITGAYVEPDSFLVWVKTDKLLDGTSIQANASSCVPASSAGTTWFKVEQTTTASATPLDVTSDWYACYQPGSPSAGEGSSIVLYRSVPRSTDTSGNLLAPGDVGPNGGWYDMSDRDPNPYESASAPNFTPWLSGDPKSVTTYTFTGQVKDEQGHVLDIKIALNIDPDAGGTSPKLAQPTKTLTSATDGTTTTKPDPIIGTSTGVEGTDTAPVVHVVFAEGECNTGADGSGASYVLKRVDVTNDGDPIPVATFTPSAAVGTTFTYDDSTTATNPIAYNTKYAYHLYEEIPLGGDATNLYEKELTPARTVTVLIPPSAPTLDATTTPGTVKVSWAASPSATTYTVQRAAADTKTYTDAIPTGTWISVATTDQLTLNDPGRPPATAYFYRVVAKSDNGSSEPGAAALVTTP